MAGEGEKREGGEGPSEEADFAEYVEYLREKEPRGRTRRRTRTVRREGGAQDATRAAKPRIGGTRATRIRQSTHWNRRESNRSGWRGRVPERHSPRSQRGRRTFNGNFNGGRQE